MELLIIKSSSYWVLPGAVFIAILTALFVLNVFSLRKEKMTLEEDFG
ncbi:MAG: hypothetical protein ABW036_09535 [Flavitalea sp.]